MSVTSRTSSTTLLERGRPLAGLSGVAVGLFFSALLLALIGVAAIHSASAELPIDYLPRQALWIGVGLVALLVGALVDYHLLLRHATPIYLGGLAAIALVLIFGHEAGGARSWVGIAGLGGQPSDYAKLATAILLARYLGGLRREYLGLRQLLVAGAIVSAPMMLIILQPDLGTAMMFVPLYAGMIFLAGVRTRPLLVSLGVGLLLASGVWAAGPERLDAALDRLGLRDYQQQRILSFVFTERDPLGAGYQVRQSKIAVGSGAILGKGYRQGTQSQLRFLPARHTDFVFAVLAEEAGFVGVALVLLLYLLFLGNGVRIAARARDRSGVLLAGGLLAALCGHVLYNTAMVIGLVPVTGIPIPFLSYGGSFALFSFFTTGLLLGIDSRRYVNRR